MATAAGNTFNESLSRINSIESNNRRVTSGMKVNKMFDQKGVGGAPGSQAVGGGINRKPKGTSQH